MSKKSCCGSLWPLVVWCPLWGATAQMNGPGHRRAATSLSTAAASKIPHCVAMGAVLHCIYVYIVYAKNLWGPSRALSLDSRSFSCVNAFPGEAAAPDRWDAQRFESIQTSEDTACQVFLLMMMQANWSSRQPPISNLKSGLSVLAPNCLKKKKQTSNKSTLSSKFISG